ncbi:Phosphoenolpyruvate/pyruvate domain-containing protein [Mycena floridula]|nr:Phosphoenolpyruvate/pyruvate domain-containing protein [Mycena floridula]
MVAPAESAPDQSGCKNFLGNFKLALFPLTIMSGPIRGSTRLRKLLEDPKHLVVAPGVFDGMTARSALGVGFEALYMTGAGTSMSRLGWADLGLATLNDMKQNAEMIASLDRTVPVIADADTGYGGPIMVARTVEAYAQAGIAALHIEDQVQNKRCGHLLGKQLVDKETYASRIRAAYAARERIGSDILIIARTDARQGLGFDEAVDRLKAAVEAGADVAFLEGFQSVEEGKKIVEIMGTVPVLVNIVPGGASPQLSVEEAKEIGFRIMILPAILVGPVLQTCTDALKELKKTGKQPEGLMGVREFFERTGLEECLAIDRAAGGTSYDTTMINASISSQSSASKIRRIMSTIRESLLSAFLPRYILTS